MALTVFDKLDVKQKIHFGRMAEILDKYNIALDLSRMGAGKTYTAGALVGHLGLPNVMVVCPVSVSRTWEMFFAEHESIFKDKFNSKTIISYEGLRCNMAKGDPVGFKRTSAANILTCEVVFVKGKKKNVFTPTKDFEALCASGMVVVFDEAHRMKNLKTQTSDSVNCVIGCINKINNKSKIILLSGTLFDKKEQVFSISRLLGIYKPGDKMCTKTSGSIKHNVVENMRDFIVRHTDAKKVTAFDAIVSDNWNKFLAAGIKGTGMTSSAKFSEAVFFDAMIQILIPAVSSVIEVESETMVTPAPASPLSTSEDCSDTPTSSSTASSSTASAGKSLKCGILLAKDFETEVQRQELKHEVEKFCKLVGFYTRPSSSPKRGRGVVGVPGEEEKPSDSCNFSHIIKILERIEYCKVPNFLHHLKTILAGRTRVKVVVSFNFNQSIKRFHELVVGRNIVPSDQVRVVTGATSSKLRAEAFDSFQSDDKDSAKLIIANTKVISLGVSLDDQTGVYPRYALASPSYMAIDQHQFIRRFYRKNTKSEVNVYFVYSDEKRADSSGKLLEEKLLNSISVKSDIIKKISEAAGDDASRTIYMSDFKTVEIN